MVSCVPFLEVSNEIFFSPLISFSSLSTQNRILILFDSRFVCVFKIHLSVDSFLNNNFHRFYTVFSNWMSVMEIRLFYYFTHSFSYEIFYDFTIKRIKINFSFGPFRSVSFIANLNTVVVICNNIRSSNTWRQFHDNFPNYCSKIQFFTKSTELIQIQK